MRVRLYELFVQIEREFEILYAENLSLQEKVDTLTSSNTNQCNQNPETQQNFLQTTTSSTSLAQHQQQPQQQQQNNNNLTGSLSVPITPATSTTTPLGLGLGLSSNKMSRALYAHKLRTHTNKLKQHTNKIMSNFKGKPYFLSRPRCLKIPKKVSFNLASEASYVYILSGQKLIKNCQILASF